MATKRQLGRSTLHLPPIMLGANVFGWTTSVEQSFNVLDAALDHGLNAIDTANVYSRWVPGHAGGESASGSKNAATVTS